MPPMFSISLVSFNPNTSARSFGMNEKSAPESRRPITLILALGPMNVNGMAAHLWMGKELVALFSYI